MAESSLFREKSWNEVLPTFIERLLSQKVVLCIENTLAVH